MKTATILVVDDTSANIDIAVGVVGSSYNVKVAFDGKKALAIVAKSPPDLILLDIIMPEMDGIEVLEILKSNEHWRHIPVVMISALDEFKTVVKCIEKGADDYLVKPFDPVLLIARVKSSLEKKRLYDMEVQLRNELEQSYNDLKKAETARDGLSHMIVHDLNNPLTSIIGFQNLLLMKLKKGKVDIDDIIIKLNTMNKSSEQMQMMIQGILDVSKIESGSMPVQLETMDISSMIQQVVDMSQSSVSQNKSVAWNKKDDVFAYADKNLTLRIVQNMVSNAIKHSAENSEVTIDLEIEKKQLFIKVKDNGLGIPGKLQDKVFDKFFQVESRDQATKLGVGLGLSFCKMAAQLQGGDVLLESEPGEGSCFILQLPIPCLI